MTSSLFRQRAIEEKANTLEGEAHLAGPLSFKLVAATAVASALALVLFIVFGTYTKKVTVRGYVTTTEANVRVYPPVSGIIDDIFVENGEAVRRGQPIAKISLLRVSSQEASVQSSIRDSLQDEAEALQSQITTNETLTGQQLKALDERIDGVLYQIGVIKGQRVDARERLTLAEKNFERVSNLRGQGLVSQVNVDTVRADVLDLRLAFGDLDNSLATQRNLLAQLRNEREQLPAISASRAAGLRTSLEQIRQRISDVEAREALIAIAPVDGRVNSLGRRLGQSISVEAPLVSLLPNEREFYAELFVPGHLISFIRPESPIQLRYDAFPHQEFGLFPGTVDSISATPLMPNEMTAPIQLLEPGYLVTVTLTDQQVVRNGRPQDLQAGMTLSADVSRETRRIIEWIVDPLIFAARRTQ